MMRPVGTQLLYSVLSTVMEASPSADDGPPIMTRSGESWSVIALPSRANSGFESMTTSWEQTALKTLVIDAAVVTGTVERSTMILGPPATLAIRRATDSQCSRFGA